mgnify:CR=1 FL=1
MKTTFETKLTIDELNNVAGGNVADCVGDAAFLHNLNGSCKIYNINSIQYGHHDKELKKAWASVGIDAEIHSGNFFSLGKPNVYRIICGGRVVSRGEAMDYAMYYYKHRNDTYDDIPDIDD